jgi:glycosyltransferase involved in cell wall biosynthesis
MLRLIYIIGTYPLLTTTFIDREIAILRRWGVDLQVVAMRRPDADTPLSDDQRALQRGVLYLLPAALTPLLLSQVFFALTRPRRYVQTLAYLLTRPHASPGARLKTLLHFGEGVYTAFLLRGREFHELHAHFVDRAATVALVAGRLLDKPYSLSIHAAADIFVSPVLLREKIGEARHAVTCTGFNKAHLEALVGADLGPRISKVYHGLNLDRYRPARAPEAGPPLIVSVGQLVARKGLAILVRSCRLLRDRGYNFRCEIVGRGPQHAELQALIADLGLEGSVTLRGALRHEEVIALYSRASMFVLPCRKTSEGDLDGIPNVIAEAMAMELPVISTGVSAIPELLDDGVNGLLAPVDDPAGLAERMARLLDDPALRAELGRSGRRSVLGCFDVEHNVRHFAATLWPDWFAPHTAD